MSKYGVYISPGVYDRLADKSYKNMFKFYPKSGFYEPVGEDNSTRHIVILDSENAIDYAFQSSIIAGCEAVSISVVGYELYTACAGRLQAECEQKDIRLYLDTVEKDCSMDMLIYYKTILFERGGTRISSISVYNDSNYMRLLLEFNSLLAQGADSDAIIVGIAERNDWDIHSVFLSAINKCGLEALAEQASQMTDSSDMAAMVDTAMSGLKIDDIFKYIYDFMLSGNMFTDREDRVCLEDYIDAVVYGIEARLASDNGTDAAFDGIMRAVAENILAIIKDGMERLLHIWQSVTDVVYDELPKGADMTVDDTAHDYCLTLMHELDPLLCKNESDGRKAAENIVKRFKELYIEGISRDESKNIILSPANGTVLRFELGETKL